MAKLIISIRSDWRGKDERVLALEMPLPQALLLEGVLAEMIQGKIKELTLPAKEGSP